MLKDTPEDFKFWLLTKSPDEVIGISSGHHCPLASFLKYIYASDIKVSNYVASIGDGRAELSPWMIQFIKEVDCRHNKEEISVSQSLTYLTFALTNL